MMRLALNGTLFTALAFGSGCATLAEGGAGDENLPNARAGPFRALRAGELGASRVAPNGLDDGDSFAQAPAVVDADDDPATPEAWGYFAASPAPEGAEPDPKRAPTAIVRYRAADGRSFDRFPVTVLEPSEPWEGGTVGAPAAVWVRGELYLYYAAAGGVGLARSADGTSFAREVGPVLGPATSGWDAGLVPASPGVTELADGSFRMFYEVSGEGGASRIGEARSDDGIAWTRVGGGPALAPRADGPAYDDASVGCPFPVAIASAEDRAVLRLYYAARDAAGHEVIALAARFDELSPFDRATSPVFGTESTLAPREPCVVVEPALSLLFVTQRAGREETKDYPAVAVGVAPGTASLPPASPP